MQVGALGPYEESLLTARPLELLSDDGRTITLDIARWLAPVDDADNTVLDRCVGPTLDVGCGPGRFVEALSERGVISVGVDIAETAVTMTRSRGVPAVLRSVFAPIPGEGRWKTVLLMDGNIGIGGDPARLLARVAVLLGRDGVALVETDPDDQVDSAMTVRFTQHGDTVGPSFPWAHVGLEPLVRYARDLGFEIPDIWTASGRTFVALQRR